MEVIVLGAGIGGMSCAALLANSGHSVTVLEQNYSYGGKAGQISKKGVRVAGPCRVGRSPIGFFNLLILNNAIALSTSQNLIQSCFQLILFNQMFK